VIEALMVLVGGSIAVLLDWAIYTHLSAYIRVGFPAMPNADYRRLALGNSAAVVRTITVSTAGMAAGLAFALRLAPVWLLSVGFFVVAHSLLYALLYKRR
jgi:hypothetical protein